MLINFGPYISLESLYGIIRIIMMVRTKKGPLTEIEQIFELDRVQ